MRKKTTSSLFLRLLKNSEEGDSSSPSSSQCLRIPKQLVNGEVTYLDWHRVSYREGMAIAGRSPLHYMEAV